MAAATDEPGAAESNGGGAPGTSSRDPTAGASGNENGGDAADGTTAASAAASAAAAPPSGDVARSTPAAARTPPQSADDDDAVIEISSGEPPSSRKSRPSGSGAGGGGSAAKKQRITMGDGGDSDSDVEILSPSRYPARMRPGPSGSGGGNDEGGTMETDEDDDIVVTSSNTTNPNVDYPHMRHQCGVHPFVPLGGGNSGGNSNFCPKCYCFVCDAPASECTSWRSGHCHAHDGKDGGGGYVQLREATLKARGVDAAGPVDTGEVTHVPPSAAAANPYQQQQQRGVGNPYSHQQQRQRGGEASAAAMHDQIVGLIHNEFLSRLASEDDQQQQRRGQQQQSRARERKDMRIHEVLAENFQKAVSLASANAAALDAENDDGGNLPKLEGSAASGGAGKAQQKQKVDGDIPSMSLCKSFYVESVKIGWPFPKVMKPQRQMAMHLIRALKNSRHVVLESPTGTGKSAAILCSVLAWQRHHARAERSKRDGGAAPPMIIDGEEGGGGGGGDVPNVKIIYCSRTHSQVAQMVASLKSTPYRPRMAILGSRDRLCIHKSIRPRGPGAEDVTGVNVNNECRLRVRNTEKSRKHQLANPGHHDAYNDDDPPETMPGDGDGGQQQQEEDGGDGPAEGENDGFLGRRKTCPHYRQLTASRVANLAHSTFVPNAKVDCCSVGGKKSKYGAHDIEDLVDWGLDPYRQKDVALYRKQPDESFGLSLKGGAGRAGGCFVRGVKKDTPADVNGSIKVGDRIVRVNGTDVSNAGPGDVVNKIKDASSDPLMLDISRGGSGSLSSARDGEYSSRAACPYYLSHVLAKDADIVFAPYNYVLDPGIRDALGIELSNSVVVLDEAHNVEGTLREAGSLKVGEFELCDLIVMLGEHAVTEKSTNNLMDISGDAGLGSESESAYLCDVAHALLIFVEKLVAKLRMDRTFFQNNPGSKGAAKALRDWEKFHTPDDTEFEVSFDGPTGKGIGGNCVGCMPFFEKLGLTKSDMDSLVTYVDAFEKFFRGRESNDGSPEKDRISNLVDRLMELVHKFSVAIQTPEHYYLAVLATANGSLDFANGGDGESEPGRRRKRPKALPLMAPKTQAHPERPANPCTNTLCRAQCTDPLKPIRHGDFCNGATPKWEAHLHLDLLTPGPLMQDLANQCRTVVLASGSLSPIPSLCAELNFFPADASADSAKNLSSTLPKIQRRLQNQPRPLEADHVVNLDKQLFALSIGHFPDGSELTVSHKNYSKPDFLPKLGDALVRIVSGIPKGGVLVFLPSYALLRKCERIWNPNGYRQNNRRGWWTQNDEPESDEQSIWDRLKAVKHNVIVEPSGGQDEFEEAKAEYMDSVKTLGGCVLLAVYRGKMSEGISFNDDNARGVVCVGLPLPSAFALPVKVKMDYNNEQRRLKNRTDLLPGREWYNQQAYRAIAQALGRCIRHVGDYGAVFLLDSRHCDDGSPNGGIPAAHKNLPQWMRRAVKNLSRQSSGRSSSMFNYVSSSNNSVLGGWPGLKAELQRFFRNAKPYASDVLQQQNGMLAAASVNERSTPLVPPTSQSQSNASSNSSVATPKTSSSSSVDTRPSSSSDVYVIESQPAKSIQTFTKKKGATTLQEMFKKQQEADTTSQKRSATSASKSAKKLPSTRNTLKSMFEKQRTNSLAPTQEMVDVDEEEEEEGTSEQSQASSTDHAAVESNNGEAAPTNEDSRGNSSFTFKRSPFADEMLTPATEVAASTSQLALSQGQPASASQLAIFQSQAGSAVEEEEHLCVVCEDGKKQVMLMPCKHMCLCKSCATRCLGETMKECPMCRTKIQDSIEVFW